ncbi:ATP-binding protein [Pseudogemmobacter faecipullorum]|uniref:histidine kinase n=1 Tax=Pseudogemmobacter faecipullorum TaxID=2755041 RepID=A0ABS8CMR5_9RHOB|nr:ATP-binding protein [Pseudogemmobacter faecipullorum]MCB5410688.1 sensor histidine kinase N-terminal domain-containing protein [Pseudogemmobacter faecipullorum]
MTSIRARLFAILLAATGIVWLSAVLWIQYYTRTEVAQVLDRRLQESAQMVASLIARNGGIVAPDSARLVEHAPALPDTGPHSYARQLICQVWGFDGELKSGSEGAPLQQLAEGGSGFSESEVNGETWRVYSHVDPELDIRVMVGDSLTIRNALVNGVAFGLFAPAMLILPLLAAIIWLSLQRGLQPLDQLARVLQRRAASDLSPLPQQKTPTELKPMIAALNGLFARVEATRERERSFTAFAAHELKTPLAGLKTQAQIALRAPDAATRERALLQITGGVDRTDRMVRQLLDMTAAESDGQERSGPCQEGARLIADVAESLGSLAQAHGVTISLPEAPAAWRTGRAAQLAPALRNLLENAILAAPAGSVVETALLRQGDAVIFRIQDRGAGIAAQDRPFVTERFWRGAASPSGQGSGLGLAIVSAIMERMGGRLQLSAREGGGEQAELILPAS